jgi:antitoxin ParD1/3/4
VPDNPITVNVSEERLRFAAEQVSDGHYPSVDAVVEDGVRLVQERAAKHAMLIAALEKGVASGPPEPFDFDEFLAGKRAAFLARG